MPAALAAQLEGRRLAPDSEMMHRLDDSGTGMAGREVTAGGFNRELYFVARVPRAANDRGKLSVEHRQIIVVIACCHDVLHLHSQMTADFAERAALAVVVMTEANV